MLASKFCCFLTCLLWLSLIDGTIFYRKLACDWEGCNFKALQQSNMDTHKRRQYVLIFIIFPPPHWCILLLLAPRRSRLFVKTTPVAIFGLVIRHHFSVTGRIYTNISLGLAARLSTPSQPLQPLPWVPQALPRPPSTLLHTFLLRNFLPLEKAVQLILWVPLLVQINFFRAKPNFEIWIPDPW